MQNGVANLDWSTTGLSGLLLNLLNSGVTVDG